MERVDFPQTLKQWTIFLKLTKYPSPAYATVICVKMKHDPTSFHFAFLSVLLYLDIHFMNRSWRATWGIQFHLTWGVRILGQYLDESMHIKIRCFQSQYNYSILLNEIGSNISFFTYWKLIKNKQKGTYPNCHYEHHYCCYVEPVVR